MPKKYQYPGKPKLIHLHHTTAKAVAVAAAREGLSAKKYIEAVIENHINPLPNVYSPKKEYKP